MQTAFVLTGGGSLGAKGHSDQLSEMAAAPVRERVAVIVPGGDDAIYCRQIEYSDDSNHFCAALAQFPCPAQHGFG
jgi:hypothetical protein